MKFTSIHIVICKRNRRNNFSKWFSIPVAYTQLEHHALLVIKMYTLLVHEMDLIYFLNLIVFFFQTILTRKNHLNGIQYKDDPTIFAWELMNEPRCMSDVSGDTLQVSLFFTLQFVVRNQCDSRKSSLLWMITTENLQNQRINLVIVIFFSYNKNTTPAKLIISLSRWYKER